MVKQYKEDVRMPILYFSQLLGLALGIPQSGPRLIAVDRPSQSLWEKLGNGGAR